MHWICLQLLTACMMIVPTHKYYISVSDITYNQQLNVIQVSTRIFTDDLELALYNFSSQKVDLSNAESEVNNSLLSKYMRAKILLHNGNAAIKLNWVGYEYNQDAIWCYMETDPMQAPPKVLNIKHTVLFDAFDEQQNVVNFIFKDQTKSKIFSISDYQYTFNLQ